MANFAPLHLSRTWPHGQHLAYPMGVERLLVGTFPRGLALVGSAFGNTHAVKIVDEVLRTWKAVMGVQGEVPAAGTPAAAAMRTHFVVAFEIGSFDREGAAAKLPRGCPYVKAQSFDSCGLNGDRLLTVATITVRVAARGAVAMPTIIGFTLCSEHERYNVLTKDGIPCELQRELIVAAHARGGPIKEWASNNTAPTADPSIVDVRLK